MVAWVHIPGVRVSYTVVSYLYVPVGVVDSREQSSLARHFLLERATYLDEKQVFFSEREKKTWEELGCVVEEKH